MKNFRYWLKGLLYWVVVPIFSGPLKGCRFGLFTGSRFITGKYGRAEVNHVLELAKPGQVVFDIGAHVGYFTILASRAVVDGRVFAFEPLSLNLTYLHNHVRINHCENTQVLSCAVGQTAGKLFFNFGKGSGRGSIQSRVTTGATNNGLEVQVVGLDEMINEGKLPPPHLIKMDIEGAEVEALKGASELFTLFRPNLLLSTHGEAIREECEALLRKWNYEISPISNSNLCATPRS